MRRRSLLSGGLALGLTGPVHAARPPVREGYAQVTGGKVWYQVTGDGPRTPLLTLHGGPGAGHDYLKPLTALADQRPVVLYDQLGCCRSDKPEDPRLWHIERFCDEIDALRRHLGLGKVILYGHSWGGWLALEYMARRGPRAPVEALVLASTSASIAQFVAGARRLLAAMPGDLDAQRRRLEAAGQMGSPAYAALVDRFYDAHLVHFDAAPPPYAAMGPSNLETSRTYPAMNGPNEFTVTGTLKGWDRHAQLKHIHVPTLVLTSQWDEVSLDCHETLHRGIRGSKLVVIPGARHLAMLEKPAVYVRVLRDFLAPLA